MPKGVDVPNETIFEVRRLLAAGCTQREAARMVGLGEYTILRINLGRTLPKLVAKYRCPEGHLCLGAKCIECDVARFKQSKRLKLERV